jgi:acyl-coenzyme A thioesterase PaaI-like protein
LSADHADGHNTSDIQLPQNHCFGCGPDNPDGMRLKFRFDEAAHQALCDFVLPRRYQGPPNHSHGGIIATILDEAMGKVNKLRNVIALTKSMNIEYLKPVPLETPLLAVGFEKQVNGREHHNWAEIRNAAGEVLARSEGVFVAVDRKRLEEKLRRNSSASAADVP